MNGAAGREVALVGLLLQDQHNTPAAMAPTKYIKPGLSIHRSSVLSSAAIMQNKALTRQNKAAIS